MEVDPPGSGLTADDPHPEDIERAAAIDDFFGGFTAGMPAAVRGLADAASPLPGSLDLLLLLRQAGASRAAPPATMPERIGRYRIVRLAGHGGFSVVWEAFDPALHRRVAVKSCAPDALVSPTARRRFRREAELASRLTHPHIVTIHEVGSEDGLDFITAEFCEGGSLADWLARHAGPVPPVIAARIAQAVAQAVAHAHDAGIVHRDIKPGNVMLVPVDGRNAAQCIIPAEPSAAPMTVKLGDFGLGRLNDPGDSQDPLTQLTVEGARLGTPAWMAPEQIDRSFGDVGPATDVHAVGLLLDRMLTGRPLRGGGTTDVETYREVLLDDPVAADNVVRGVPADLAAVCLRCLAKQPRDRYGSAVDLADDLGRWLAGLPTHARPLSPAARMARLVSRRPLAAGLLTATLVASCIAGWTLLERSRDRRLAISQDEQIRRHNAAGELLRAFDSLRSANVAGALEHVARTRALDPDLAASLAGRWLHRRLHGERDLLLQAAPEGETGRPTELYCLAVSPSGDAAAVGGADGRLRLVRHLDGHPTVEETVAHDEINDVCFSPDGLLVASAGQDGRLRWCLADSLSQQAGEAPRVGCPLYGVAFSADGNALCYGGEDRVVRRFQLDGRHPPEEMHRIAIPEGESGEIEAIAQTGAVVAVVCGGLLTVLDASDGRVLWSWRRQEDLAFRDAVLHALAISHAGDLIAAGGTDREVHVWDTATGAVVCKLPAHPNWIQGCRFSPDGGLLATACRDGVVRVFEVATGAMVKRLVGHVGRVWDIAFTGAKTLVTSGADGSVRRWSLVEPSPMPGLRTLAVRGRGIEAVREAPPSNASAESARLMALRSSGSPFLIAIDDGATTELPAADNPWALSLAVDRPRNRAAFGLKKEAARATATLVSLETGSISRPSPAQPDDGVPAAVCWTPQGALVACMHDRRIVIWTPSCATGTVISDFDQVFFGIEAAPCGPPRIAAAGKPGWILPLDTRSAARRVRLGDVGDQIAVVAWSPDAGSLACGLRNGALHVFSTASGDRIGTLAPHERQVVEIVYSPDGRALITADADCVRLSDATTLTTFDEFRPGWRIETMCLAGDGRFVVLGGNATDVNPAAGARLAVFDMGPP